MNVIHVGHKLYSFIPPVDHIFEVPQDYDDLLSYYTRRGYRVIAVAGKSIEGLTWLKAQKMKR